MPRKNNPKFRHQWCVLMENPPGNVLPVAIFTCHNSLEEAEQGIELAGRLWPGRAMYIVPPPDGPLSE